MKKINNKRKVRNKTLSTLDPFGSPIITGTDTSTNNKTVTNMDGTTSTVDASGTSILEVVLENGTTIYVRTSDLKTIIDNRSVYDLLVNRNELLEDKYIKILPTDFVPNDDNQYYNAYIEDDVLSFPVRASYGITALYAFKEIPLNHAIDKVIVNIQNKQTTGAQVEVYEGFITSTSSVLKGNAQGNVVGDQQLTINLSTPVYSKADNLIIIKFVPTSLSDLFYGGTMRAVLT